MNTTVKVLISVAAVSIIAGVGYFLYRRAAKKAVVADLPAPVQEGGKTTLTAVKPIIDNTPKAVNKVITESRGR